jgi:hypothetical protein
MAKNNAHDEEKYIISADGQIHAFPEDGLSEDFVDLEYEKATERMKQALAEEAGAKDEKAHAAAVHKTKLRQLYWAEIEALREAARVASLRYPRAVMVAMDSLDTPRVVRGFALPIFSLADSVFYAAYLEGNPVEPVGNAVDLDDRNVVTPLDEVEEGAA